MQKEKKKKSRMLNIVDSYKMTNCDSLHANVFEFYLVRFDGSVKALKERTSSQVQIFSLTGLKGQLLPPLTCYLLRFSFNTAHVGNIRLKR